MIPIQQAQRGGSADGSVISHKHTFSGGSAASAGAHTHQVVCSIDNADLMSGSANGYPYRNESGGSRLPTTSAGAHTHTVTGTISTVGVNGTGKNMPPYLTVYVWERIA